MRGESGTQEVKATDPLLVNAGLMHNIFMRDRAVLMELFIDGSGANKHFHNMAKWYGRRYVELPGENPVRVQALVASVRREIEALNLVKY
jgi:hypothetical protein